MPNRAYWPKLINHIERNATICVLCASIFVMLILLQSLFLTWISQFKILYLSLSIFISSILTIISFRLIRKDATFLPSVSIQVIGLVLIVCSIGIFYPHETFGGRDEGSYSNVAAMLSKNTNLLFSSNIRSAVGNNAGEDTQKVVAFETPAYYVWLATQNVFFGLGWMLRSNIVLASLGLCFLFLVSSSIIKKTLGIVAVVLYASSMPFLWFFRETMSENLAFFLLWTSLAFCFAFYRTKRIIYLVGLMLGTWLFAFTRLEGLFILCITFLTLSFILLFTKIFPVKKSVIIILTYLAVILSAIAIQKPFTTNSLLKVNVKKIDYLVKRSASGLRVTTNPRWINTTIPKEIKLLNRVPFFTFQMLEKYNLVIVLLSTFLILPLIVVDKKMSKITKIYIIVLLIILLPEFYKFIDPAVTMEQPWMYRRYLYALLPVGYIFFTIFLNRVLNRKFMFIFVLMLLVINILLSSNILFLKNNWSLTEQLDKIIENVSPEDDLVIIDGWTLFDNYYPTSYLNYHRNIRAIVQNTIDRRLWGPEENKYKGLSYKKLYFLTDKLPGSFKNQSLIQNKSIEVKYEQLQPNCRLSILNSELGLPSANLYLLPYSSAVAYCSKTDNDILTVKKRIYLYEIMNIL